ncbi:MAG: RHS repeat-associated core domain-containing protein [Acidobacteriota bacterium]
MTTIPAVSNAGLGWNVSLGGELYVAKDKFADTEIAQIPAGWPANRDSLWEDDWIYVDSSGGRHAFRGNGETMYSRDGSYLRLREVSSEEVHLDLPSGLTQEFEHFLGGHCPIPGSAPKGCWRLQAIRDSFGNWVQFDHSDSAETVITDSHGREITVEYTTLNTGGERFQTWATRHIDSIDFPSTNGPVTWDLDLDPTRITRASPVDHENFPADDMDITVHLLRGIVPPGANGRWDFEYNEALYPPSREGANPKGGLLERVTSPLRGSIEYVHGNVFLPITCGFNGSAGINPPFTSQQQGVTQRIVRTADAMLESHKIFTYQGVDRKTDGGQCSRSNTMETHVIENVPFGGDSVNNHHYRHEVYFHNVTKAVGTGVDLPEDTEWSHRDFGLPIAKSRSIASNFGSQPELDLYLSSIVLDCETKGTFLYEPGLETPNVPSGCAVHRETYLRHAYSTPASSCTDGGSIYGSCNFRSRPVSGRLQQFFRNAAVHEYREDLFAEFDGFGNFRRQTTKSNLGTSLQTVEYTKTYAMRPGGAPIQQIATLPAGETTFGTMPAQSSVGPWIFGLYETKQSNPDGKVRRSDYTFDERGFLECERTYSTLFNSITGNDPTGNPAHRSTAYSEVADGKGWVELEQHGLGAGSGGCVAAPEYRVKHAYALGQRTRTAFVDSGGEDVAPPSLHSEPDPATGWITASCDHSVRPTLCTTITYDVLGRPTSRTSAGTAVNTTLDYSLDVYNSSDVDGGGRVVVEVRDARNSNQNTNLVEQIEMVYDSIGRETEVYRAISEARSDPREPDAAADRIVQVKGYQRGRLDYVTSVHDETLWDAMEDAPREATRFQYEQYDIHGRILGVHNPKGERATFQYLQGAVSQRVTETAFGNGLVRGDTISDHLGRPVRVDEGILNNDVNSPGRRTTFSYDGGVATAQRGDQKRQRQLDGRGLLVWELIPEKIDAHEVGNLEIAKVRYTYDSLGNVLTSQDNGVHLAFTYDAAGRLETVREVTRDDRLLERRFYDTIPNGGRLDRSIRYNYYSADETGGYAEALIPDHVIGGEILLLEVQDRFEYDDRGNVKTKTTRIDRSFLNGNHVEVEPGGTPVHFTASWTYDGAGRPVEVIYPEAVGASPFDAFKDLRLQLEYEVGELVGVSLSDTDGTPAFRPVLGYDYHPSGSIHYRYRYDLAGDFGGWDEITEYAYAAEGAHGAGSPELRLPRVGEIHVYGQTGTNPFHVWSSGAYDYDGRGQIDQIGATTYSYDALRRLHHAGTGSAYSYDEFDNVLGGGELVSFTVNEYNNRLNTALGGVPVEYDSRGNMTGGGCPDEGICALNSRYDAYGRQLSFWWNLNSRTDHDGDGDLPGTTPRRDVTDWDQQAVYAYSAAGERVFLFSRLPEDEGYSTPTGVIDPAPCEPGDGNPDGCLDDDFSESIFTFFGGGGPLREFRQTDEVTSTSRNNALGIRSYIGKEAVLREGSDGTSVIPYTLKHLTSDHLGSTRISRRFLDGGGAAGGFARDDFSAWGHLEDSAIGETFGYAGHMMDRNGTNGDPEGAPGALYPIPRDREWYSINMNARSYIGELGRFVSPDPARSAGAWSLYAYAANDPINMVDPSGLTEEEADRPGTETATVDGGGKSPASGTDCAEESAAAVRNGASAEGGCDNQISEFHYGLEAELGPPGLLKWLLKKLGIEFAADSMKGGVQMASDGEQDALQVTVGADNDVGFHSHKGLFWKIFGSIVPRVRVSVIGGASTETVEEMTGREDTTGFTTPMGGFQGTGQHGEGMTGLDVNVGPSSKIGATGGVSYTFNLLVMPTPDTSIMPKNTTYSLLTNP